MADPSLPWSPPAAAAVSAGRKRRLAAGRAHPSAAELRLADGTPLLCGRSRTTAVRSDLAGRLRPRHLASLLLLGQAAAAGHHLRGAVTSFGLANPKLYGESEHARLLLSTRLANRPPWGPAVVTDKGLSGTEEFFAGLGLCLVRPPRADEPDGGAFPDWLRRGSRRSSGRSSTSWAWAIPAAASRQGSGLAWCSACSPSTP
jgi:hypothetical protein